MRPLGCVIVLVAVLARHAGVETSVLPRRMTLAESSSASGARVDGGRADRARRGRAAARGTSAGSRPTPSTTRRCGAWGCPGTTSSSARSSRAGASSIDKPPVDLWLQVASVKLLGFSTTTLKLPEAFAGILSVPLLFAAVRRMWSTAAGLVAAVGAGGAAGRGDHLAQRHDGRGDDGADRARAVPDRARVRDRALRLAAGGRGGAGRRLRRQAPGVPGRPPRPGAARLPGPARTPQAAPAADARRRRGVRRGRAGVADRDPARPRPRPPVRDRLDQRQRLERGVRVQRDRPPRRQIARTVADRLRGGAPLPRRHPVRARPHPDRAPLPHTPAGADRAALGRAAGAGAARRAAAGHPGAGLRTASETACRACARPSRPACRCGR